MISETIQFEDLRGRQLVETFHFQITEAEMMEMAARHHVKGGSELLDYWKTISDAEDGNAMMDAFQNVLRMSIGQIAEDEVRFLKTKEYTSRFMDSDAYNKVFVRMLREPEYALKFLNGIMPAAVQKQIAEDNMTDRKYSTQEMLDMSDEDWAKLAGTDEKNMSHEHLLVHFHRKEMRRGAA